MNPTTAIQTAALLAAFFTFIAAAIILTHKTDTDTARDALKHKLANLFYNHTEEAKHFRTRILYNSSRPDLLKQQLLDEASRWQPETTQHAPAGYHTPNSTILSGRLHQLYVEVTIKNGKAAYTLIEVD